MEEKAEKCMKVISAIANTDTLYCAMLEEMRKLEKQYDAVLHSLLTEQQDVLCDFISLCEEMSHRKLEIACAYMRFPE